MRQIQGLVETNAEDQQIAKQFRPMLPPPAVGSYQADYGPEDKTHLIEYWRAVRKRLWLVIGLTLLCTMLSAIYVARKPDVYEAQSRVQVDLEYNPALSSSAKGGSVILAGGGNDPTYFNTQLQILTGPGLLRRVAKTLDLENNQAFVRPQTTRSTWQTLLGMAGIRRGGGGGTQQQAKKAKADELPGSRSVAPTTSGDLGEAKRLAPFVSALQGGLRVQPVKEGRTGFNKETRLIDIRYNHADPEVAASVVNAVAQIFSVSNLENKTEINSTTGNFLSKRVADLQSQIRESEEKLVAYAKNNKILTLDASQNTVVERLAGLNRQLLEAENERKLAEAVYRAVLAPGAATAMAEGDVKNIAESESKLGELKQRRALLLVEATEEAAEVKEVNQQIGVLEKQVYEIRKRATDNVVTNLETRYRQSLAREQSLRTAFEQQKGETLTQNEAAINYRIIQQEIETNKTLLDGLLQRSKENDVVLAGTPNNIYVVDYALTPEGPVGPNRPRGVFMAFMLSLAAAVGLALLLEHLDDTVHSMDDVERLVQLKTLAVIPSASSASRRRVTTGSTSLQLQGGGGDSNKELLIDVDPRSPMAEAYRQLRTSVLLSTAGRAPRTLLITSSLPSEGKTTTAVNTAISLSQTGASVVIIDADMRRPRLHAIFGLKNTFGLSKILSSDVCEAEMLEMVQQNDTNNVFMLTSGPVPPNPAELIGSQQMTRLISALQCSFTHVVIDSPPISSFTDGVLISSMVDGVLLVIHGGKSSRHVVRRSRDLLRDIGAKIFGVVLNNVSQHSQDYKYYSHYYEQSYYDKDAEAEEAAGA